MVKVENYLNILLIFVGDADLVILDPKREFQAEETLGLITNNVNRAVICYFLSDMILVTERSTESSQSSRKILISL
jgi:hypothetical protein